MAADSRQRAVEDAGSTLRLTAEVLEYMEAVGDVRLLFAATVLTLAVPRTLHHARANIGTTGGSASPPGAASSSHLLSRRPTVISCNLLARDKEGVLAVGTKSVYVLPSERIPIDDILEFVAHAHCSAPFPALEIRVANPDGTNDVRFVALSSDYMLRQAIAVLQTACPFARTVFHSHGWITKSSGGGGGSGGKSVPGRASSPKRGGGGRGDDSDGDGNGSDTEEFLAMRRARMTNVASDTAQRRLSSYRKQRTHTDAAVARVATYGPGRYGEAADALSSDLGRMMKEVDRMLLSSGQPEPILSLSPRSGSAAQYGHPQQQQRQGPTGGGGGGGGVADAGAYYPPGQDGGTRRGVTYTDSPRPPEPTEWSAAFNSTPQPAGSGNGTGQPLAPLQGVDAGPAKRTRRSTMIRSSGVWGAVHGQQE